VKFKNKEGTLWSACLL